MWHCFWIGAFLWHGLCYGASSLETKKDLSFSVEITSSNFPTHAFAFRGLLQKKEKTIAWVNYYFLYQDQAKEQGYDAFITYLEAFGDDQDYESFNSILDKGQNTLELRLESLRNNRKRLERSLLERRKLLMCFLFNQLSCYHKDVDILAVEIPHGYTKEEQFYKQIGFEFIETFEHKKNSMPMDKNESEVCLFDRLIKKMRN